MNTLRIILCGFLLSIAPLLGAAEPQGAPTQFDKVRFEIGAMAGFPAVLGIQLGVWGPRNLPLLFRAASGLGSQGELGVHLPISDNSENRLILAASGGVIGYGMFSGNVLGDVGLSAGMRMGSFFFTAGPALYFGGGMGSAHLGAQGSLGLTVLY